MKILLVYPEYPPTFWSFKHVLKFIAKKAAHPPLGPLTVAGMLPRDWELRLVDMNVEKLGDGDLAWADFRLARRLRHTGASRFPSTTFLFLTLLFNNRGEQVI